MADRFRLGVTLLGIGLPVTLTLVFFSVYEGAQREATGYVANRPADLWVARDNSTNLIRSLSFLPDSVGGTLRSLPGVERAATILRTIVTVRAHEAKATLFVFGFDPAERWSAPDLVEGSLPGGAGEVVLDRAFARRHGLAVEDTLHIQERPFRVTGLSRGTNAVVTQFAFVTMTEAQTVLQVRRIVSYGLVQLVPGARGDEVARLIEAAIPHTRVYSGEDFLAHNLAEVRAGVLPVLGAVAGFGTIVAALVLTLVLYAALAAHREEIAVLKAIGAPPWWLASLVLRQSGSVVLGGYLCGLVLYAAASPLLVWIVPEVTLALTAELVVAVLAASVVVGATGSLFPILEVGRIYPAEAFRA